MRINTTLLLTLSLLGAGLSGCVGTTEDSTPDASVDADASASTQNGTVEANASIEVDPAAPEATIDLSGDALTANETENGTTYAAVAGVNITFDASNTTDDEEGNLSFSWDFGDGNTSQGAIVEYAFAGPGNVTVTLTALNEATNATGSASVDIAITAGVETTAAMEPIVLTGLADIACTQCWAAGTSTASFTYQTGVETLDGDYLEFGPGLEGKAYMVESTAGDPDVGFFDTCGGTELVFTSSAGVEQGLIPEGATCALVVEFADILSDFTLTISEPEE